MPEIGLEIINPDHNVPFLSNNPRPEKFGKIRLALIPIGAYLPAWFMSPIHCTPSEAVDIHVDVKAENSLAIHHNTFPLSDEGQYQPIEDLNTALAEKQISRDAFFVLEEGKWRDIV